MIPATPTVIAQPIPQDLKKLLPIPQTPWHTSPPLFSRIQSQNSSQPFRICEILNSDPEFEFILKYFEHQKPSNYGIKRIFCIHNPSHTQVFEGTLKNMEQEAHNPVFTPKGKDEEPRSERARVLNRWRQQIALFSPVTVPSSNSRADSCVRAKILPLWHGSSEAVCLSILSSGFTSFGKHHYYDENATKGSAKSTDKGYFGSGIYFTNSARYASMYSNGHLLLTWVSMREPYPVVNDKPHPQKGTDMIKLEGKEHYQNYNAHFIPVASIEPNNPLCMNYYPCYKDQEPTWDEFVVFHQAQTLPRFWVELGVDFPRALPSSPSEPKKESSNTGVKISLQSSVASDTSQLKELASKIHCLKTLQAHSGGVWHLSAHPNGTLVSYSENDKKIKIWNTSAGTCVRTLGTGLSFDWPHPHFLLADGILLTQTRDHKAAALWNLETGKLIRTFGKFFKGVHSFNLLAPDILAVGSFGEIQIWDMKKEICLHNLDHTNYVYALAPLPHGKFISGSIRATKLWDLSTGECLRAWEGSTVILPLSQDIIATAKLYEKTIKFWDYSTGQCIKTLRGHLDTVSSLLRLPNGLLVSASHDHTVKLWDPATGECLQTLEGHTNKVQTLALLPDETFASGVWDGTIRIWGLSSAQPKKDEKLKTQPATAGVPTPALLASSLPQQALSGQTTHPNIAANPFPPVPTKLRLSSFRQALILAKAKAPPSAPPSIFQTSLQQSSQPTNTTNPSPPTPPQLQGKDIKQAVEDIRLQTIAELTPSALPSNFHKAASLQQSSQPTNTTNPSPQPLADLSKQYRKPLPPAPKRF